MQAGAVPPAHQHPRTEPYRRIRALRFGRKLFAHRPHERGAVTGRGHMGRQLFAEFVGRARLARGLLNEHFRDGADMAREQSSNRLELLAA